MELLEKPFCMNEVKEAIFFMDKATALGPDVFFYIILPRVLGHFKGGYYEVFFLEFYEANLAKL